jgi:hypothetical protein
MSNSKIRRRRQRRQQKQCRVLGCDPRTSPWQYKLAKLLRERRARDFRVYWGPDAATLTPEERCRLAYDFITSPYENVTDEIF